MAHILIVGSKKPGLQAEALAFFSISLSHHLHIELEWIPKQHNETTDYLSRILPTTMIGAASPVLRTFRDLNSQWGPHTIERFATYYNTQLPHFNSWVWNFGSDGVDSFTSNWSNQTVQ